MDLRQMEGNEARAVHERDILSEGGRAVVVLASERQLHDHELGHRKHEAPSGQDRQLSSLHVELHQREAEEPPLPLKEPVQRVGSHSRGLRLAEISGPLPVHGVACVEAICIPIHLPIFTVQHNLRADDQACGQQIWPNPSPVQPIQHHVLCLREHKSGVPCPLACVGADVQDVVGREARAIELADNIIGPVEMSATSPADAEGCMPKRDADIR
mmetsp:Transcript_82996/g.240120  ORF Transcript_82996/g.240120 Transcript_82996/m.240120 type:complete len:214 (-) Transcript_82996:64-705(-)